MAYVFMTMVQDENNEKLKAEENEIYDFVISSSKGELEFEGIRDWIEENLIKKNE